MELNTKRAIELDNADFSLLKAIERKYNVLITITDAGRVDKYEREQSERELYRSKVFKDVKTTLREAVRARFWYYRNIVNLSYNDTLSVLSECDFCRSIESIRKYLADCKGNNNELYIDVHKQYPIFDWSGKKPNYKKIVYKDRADRQQHRERVITAHYYFYTDCLGYSDIDCEYVMCYRDFHITPKQLQRIVEDNMAYLQELRECGVSANGLRRLYPAFAWDCSIAFNDEDNLPDECDLLIDHLEIYK